MTREEKLMDIYEVIMGTRIIGTRCMIGDIYNWIDTNSNWVGGDRDLGKQKKLVISIYNLFIPNNSKPIDY